MTLVEAMASGCPVVGSDVGGIPFVVRDGVDGLLVRPGDADALADALAAVLTDPARAAALGAAGREAAVERWDWCPPGGRHRCACIERGRAPGRRRWRHDGGADRLVEAVRRRIPRACVPLLVALRFRLAWSRPAVRDDARAQMRFLLEHTRPEADLDAVARAYVRGQVWRGELRWHPELITRLRVEGIEHLLDARDRRPRRDAQLHAPRPPTTAPSPRSSRLGVAAATWSSTPTCSATTPRAGSSSTCAVACTGGGIAVSAAIGTAGHHRPAQRRARSSRSPPTSRAARRCASSAATSSARSAPPGSPPTPASPVVVMTSEVGRAGPVRPAARAARARRTSPRPQDLLEEMLALHEPVDPAVARGAPTSRCPGGVRPEADRRARRHVELCRRADRPRRPDPRRIERRPEERSGDAADPALGPRSLALLVAAQLVVALDLDLPGRPAAAGSTLLVGLPTLVLSPPRPACPPTARRRGSSTPSGSACWP